MDDAAQSQSVPGDELDLTLFVSCLNEAPRIASTLGKIRDALKQLPYSYEVLVTDDGSYDGTAEAVTAFMRSHPDCPVQLHVNPVNLGLARSYVDAAFRGRGKYFRMIWGDDIEPSESMVTILRHMGTVDLVIPYYPGIERHSRGRAALSRLYTLLVNFLSGHHLHYYNGSVLCLRYHVIRWAPRTSGFTGFLADMVTLLLDQGASYVEVPVVGRDSSGEKSASSISPKNLLSTGHTLLQIGLRRIRNQFLDSPRHRRRGHR